MLKTMDSISTKVNQLKATAQELYTSMGIEEFAKNTLDFLTQIMERINSMGKLGKFPAQALATVVSLISAIKNVAGMALTGIGKLFNKKEFKINTNINEIKKEFDELVQDRKVKILYETDKKSYLEAKAKADAIQNGPKKLHLPSSGAISSSQESYYFEYGSGAKKSITKEQYEIGNKVSAISDPGQRTKFLEENKAVFKGTIALDKIDNGNFSVKAKEVTVEEPKAPRKFTRKKVSTPQQPKPQQQDEEKSSKFERGNAVYDATAAGLQVLGSALTLFGANINKTYSEIKAQSLAFEGDKLIMGAGQLANALGAFMSGNYLGAITSLFSGVVSLVDGLDWTIDEQLEKLNQEIEEAENKSLQSRAEANELDSSLEKYERLKKARYESTEDYQAFIDFQNELGAKHTELVSYYDAEGNAIIDLNEAYDVLLQKRQQELLDKKEELKLKSEAAETELQAITDEKLVVSEGVYKGKGKNNDKYYTKDALGHTREISEYFVKNILGITKEELVDTSKWDKARKGFNYKDLMDLNDRLLTSGLEGLDDFEIEEAVSLLKEGLGRLPDLTQDAINLEDINASLEGIEDPTERLKILQDAWKSVEKHIGSLNQDLMNYSSFLDDTASQLAKVEIINSTELLKGRKGIDFMESGLITAIVSSSKYQGLKDDALRAYNDDLIDYFNTLTEEELAAAEEVLLHPERYANAGEQQAALQKVLGNKYIGYQEELSAFMADSFSNLIPTKQDFLNFMRGINLDNFDYYSGIPLEFADGIMNLWGGIQEYVNSGMDEYANHLVSFLNPLFRQVNALNNEGNYEARNELLSILVGLDYSTREGYTAAIERVKQSSYLSEEQREAAIKQLEIGMSQLFLNANTAIEVFSSRLATAAENLEKAGKFFTSGTDSIEEVQNIFATIQTLQEGVGFETAFAWDSTLGAWKLTQEGYEAYLRAVNKWLEEDKQKAEGAYEYEAGLLDQLSTADPYYDRIIDNGSTIVEGRKKDLFAISITDTDEQRNIKAEWNKAWHDFDGTYQEFLEKRTEYIKELGIEREASMALFDKMEFQSYQELIKGVSNYSDLLDVFRAVFGEGNFLREISTYLRTNNMEALTRKLLDEGYSYDTVSHVLEIAEQRQQAIYDIMSYGDEITEAQLLEWAEQLGIESDDFNIFSEAVRNGEWENVARIAGVTIDTSTQAYADAYNTWLENTTDTLTESAIALLEMEEGQMISQEFIDKLRSKYPEVADAILESFFPDGIFNGDTLGLAAEFKKHGDFKLQDAGQQVIDSYASMISSGVEGSLSREDYGKLISQFDKNINYEFTEGEKGLKFSLSTANELYAELLKIDSIAAGTVMDSMVEEYKSWYEGTLDVGNVLRRIQETREKIAAEEGKEDQTKKKQYEAELKVLNEIYARRTAEDFAFMDRDMGDLNNPLTYWENVQQAADSMYEAANSGYMGVQDFYSIMSHTQDMLIAAGMDTEIAGKECSQLILEGFRAMTSIDGEMVIPLESLGQNFVNGADGMYANFQDGIQTLAKSQIELLDAQIAMLEAVVAMEEMDFSGGKGEGIDSGDFFQWSGTRYKFTDQWKEASDVILANLSQGEIDVENTLVLIGDELISLADLFSEEKIQELINNSGFRENYAKFMELLYSFIEENGQFDLDAYQTWADSYLTPLNTMKEKLEKLGDGGTVDFSIGGITYTVTKNEDTYTITTEDGEVATDGSLEGALTKLGEAQETESEEKLAEYYESKKASTAEVEMPMEVTIVPKIETVTYAVSSDASNNLMLDENGNLLPPTSGMETITQEVPYNLDFNVNVVSENVPDALFEVLETGSGEYDITFKSSEENLTLLAGLNAEIEEMSDLITTPIELISLENLDMANLFIYELIENLKKLGTINPNIEIESTKTTVSPTTGITGELPTLAAPSSTYNPEGIFNPIKLEFEQAAEDINNNLNIQPAVDSSAAAGKAINDFSAKLKGLSFASAIYNVSLFANAIAKIPARQTIDIVLNITSTSSGANDDITRAAGTVNLSHTNGASRRITITTGGGEAKGTVALSRGTLMGELGPELVVSNGRYFVVGQNGAEFVNLADDAIVFNHLQTRQLLNNGNTSHGRPVKNERASVGMAAGNVDGPAKASAKETLDQLYQLRAMWEAMLNWSTKDLASMAGSGGGGGGGGGEGEEKTAFLAELEKWYNLLRQIAKWEEKITLEQARRQNMLSGYDYVNSLEKELDMLKKQEKAHRDLAVARGDYYKQLRNDFLGTEFAKIFTYDSDGLMQYTEEGFKILRDVLATNADGIAQFTAEEQIEELERRGIDMSSFWINDDLSTAKDANQALQNFFDREARVREQMDAAYDSYHDELIAIEETISAQTELEQEYIDTQLSFEDKLYQALEDKLQAQIDALEDEKEALENASQSYIDGLNEALNNEKNMFNKNQSKQETEQLQRRLAILERSGGSQSEINSLREQIDARLQDSYFEAAQEQIDAVQKAANAQIERLDEQINIMTDALEYQKENGLLWQEVYKMMAQWTPSQLMDFIEEYTQSMKENSPLQNQEDLKEALKEAEILDGKKRREEGEKSWGAYYSSAQGQSTLAGLSNEEIEKVKQAYIEDIVKGGSGVSAAEKEKNNILNQKAQDEAAKNAGSSSGGGSTAITEKYSGPLFNSSATPASGIVYYTNKEDANHAGSIFAGNWTNGTENFAAYGGNIKIHRVEDDWVRANGFYNGKGEAVNTPVWIKKSALLNYGPVTGELKKYLNQFKSGGLIDFTGPAWVDGTKSKPESILSAEDTALLRSRIFSDSEYSLRSAIEALRELRTNWRNVVSNEYGGGVSIDNVEINFNSGTISSDYDMRRAADVAFEELRNLARKTTGVSLNRR